MKKLLSISIVAVLIMLMSACQCQGQTHINGKLVNVGENYTFGNGVEKTLQADGSWVEVSNLKTGTFEQVGNKEVKGKLDKYITRSGVEFEVGDTLEIGYPFRNDGFDLVWSTTQLVAAGLNGSQPIPLTSASTGSIGVIKKIYAYQRKCQITTYGKGESVAYSIMNFEEAFNTGEVILPGYMTSDAALAELKKEKSKLDLELITQNDYDKRKQELVKFIK